jgi:hypothetical protein
VDVAVLADSEFREVFHLVHLSCEVLVYLFFGLVELFIVFLFSALQKGAFFILNLLSCAVDHSCQVLNELLVIA